MTITNHIEINGTVRDFETLTKEEREEIAALLSDRFMAAAGYQRREIEVYNPKREARLEMQLRRRTEELNENLRFQGLLYETIFVLAVLLIATVFALLVVTSNRFL